MADPKDMVRPDRKMPQFLSPVCGSTGLTQIGVINMPMCKVKQDSGLMVEDKANNVRCRQGCKPSRLLIAN